MHGRRERKQKVEIPRVGKRLELRTWVSEIPEMRENSSIFSTQMMVFAFASNLPVAGCSNNWKLLNASPLKFSHQYCNFHGNSIARKSLVVSRMFISASVAPRLLFESCDNENVERLNSHWKHSIKRLRLHYWSNPSAMHWNKGN